MGLFIFQVHLIPIEKILTVHPGIILCCQFIIYFRLILYLGLFYNVDLIFYFSFLLSFSYPFQTSFILALIVGNLLVFFIPTRNIHHAFGLIPTPSCHLFFSLSGLIWPFPCCWFRPYHYIWFLFSSYLGYLSDYILF